MKFYDETTPLYLETDVSGVGLRALSIEKKWHKLSKRHGTRQQHTQTHHIYKKKSIQSRKEIHQYIKRSIRHITQLGKIPSLLLCKKAKYNYRPQATGCNIQERHSNIITKTSMDTSGYTNKESK